MAGDSDSEDELEVFEVDHIVSCRVDTNGDISYLVRWKGYGSDDDTWEPDEHLTNCKDAIMNFFKNRDVKPTKTEDHLKLSLSKNSPAVNYSSDSESEEFENELEYEHKSVRKSKQAEIEIKEICHPAPLERNLRLTPERKRHLIKSEKNFTERQQIKENLTTVSKPKIRTRKRREVESDERSPQRRKLRNAKNMKVDDKISDKFYESEIDGHVITETKTEGKFKRFFLPVILTALFSIFLIGTFYAILIYDLS